MAAGDKPDSKFPIQNVILLAGAMAGALWLYQGPLKSSRPVEEFASQKVEVFGDRRVQARLWQDPFDAIVRHLEAEKQAGQVPHDRPHELHAHSLENLVDEILEDSTEKLRITALFVLTDGSPYADGAESRLRQRYALLAGLDRAGYVPTDGEHIRFFRWLSPTAELQPRSVLLEICKPETKITDESQAQPSANEPSTRRMEAAPDWCRADVPVERYEFNKDGSSQALVFWLKDQDVGDQPLRSLRVMQQELKSEINGRVGALEFRVIGPRTSGSLAKMVREASLLFDTPTQHLDLYSPWSTAPEAHVLEKWAKYPRPSSVKRGLVESKANANFARAIPTDDRLILALVDELERRGVRLRDGCKDPHECPQVALISEWDTLYGRTLPQLFEKAALPKATQKNNSGGDPESGTAHASSPIHQYGYLRGLDGETPREKENARSGGDTAQGKDKATLSYSERRKLGEQLERPEGRSQLDYVRRLAERIKSTEDDLRAKCPVIRSECPGFRAIGVLGSDVYDKLLILQALKSSFPHAIFFTTDLEARLYHTSELSWTRNLVVASHFGLSLNEILQGPIPPFRESYQTAIFFATMRALGVLKEEDATPRSQDSGMPGGPFAFASPHTKESYIFEFPNEPRLYEIGRNGPVDLSLDQTGSVQDGSQSEKKNKQQSIHQLRSPLNATEEIIREFLFGLAVLGIGWLLLIPASERVYQATRAACRAIQDPGVVPRLLVGVAALLLLLLIVMKVLLWDGPGGEPFSFSDGVSIWPSQILRGLVIVLGICFAWRIRQRHEAAVEDVGNEFEGLLQPVQVHDPDPTESVFAGWWSAVQRLRDWCRNDPTRSISAWALEENSVDARRLWAGYRERMVPRRCGLRVLLPTLLFLGAGSLALLVTELPAVPYRGCASFIVNKVVLFFSVITMVAVIFLVLDVMRLTGVFVRKLVPQRLDDVSVKECLTRLQIVARLTGRIDRFIYYPAILMAIMLLARWEYFDNWHVPLGLALVIGLNALYVVVSAVLLRRASETARQTVVGRLSRQAGSRAGPTSSESINELLERVSALREGAFLPYAEHPIFRAVALPSGAYGFVMALDILAKGF
ncbi:hypothetical protein YTPLAS18_31970 [Nitrospira sp.]|nr:hypothetical protein YTPLAS18_31970 [Nitrospira sp.]